MNQIINPKLKSELIPDTDGLQKQAEKTAASVAISFLGQNKPIFPISGLDEITASQLVANTSEGTFYGPANDLISGGVVNDKLFGGKGDDTINGGNGDDTLYAGNGNDMIEDEEGNDTIYGGKNSDTLISAKSGINGGINEFISGQGSDKFVLSLGTNGTTLWRDFNSQERDEVIIETGPGYERDIVFNGSFTNITLNGQEVASIAGDARQSIFTSYPSKFDQQIPTPESPIFQSALNEPNTNQFQDSISVRKLDELKASALGTGNYVANRSGQLSSAKDFTYVSPANNIKLFATGNPDQVQLGSLYSDFGTGFDTFAGKGDDLVIGGEASDTVFGGQGKDELTGNGGDDILSAGKDNDILNGFRGNDNLTGGQGGDVFDFTLRNDINIGTDTITDFNPVEGDKIKVNSIFDSGFVGTGLTIENIKIIAGGFSVNNGKGAEANVIFGNGYTPTPNDFLFS